MKRILRIKRKKRFAGCLIPYTVVLDGKGIGTVLNGGTFHFFIGDNDTHTLRISGITSTGEALSDEYIIPAGDSSLSFLLITEYSFFRGSSYSLEPEEISDPQMIPLTAMTVSENGISYRHGEITGSVSYSDAHLCWRNNNGSKASKPAYICDFQKEADLRLIFYTDPVLIFYTDPAEESLWIETLNKLTELGYHGYDIN